MNVRRSGFSLIEALIALSILLVGLLGTVTLVHYIQSAIRGVHQKLEVAELKTLLLSTVGRNDICTWQLSGTTLDTTGATTTTPLSAQIPITTWHEGPDSSSPALATSGAKLPNSNYGLLVSSIRVTRITWTGIPNRYRGVLQIAFSPINQKTPLRPLELTFYFQTDAASPPSAKSIVGCSISPPTVTRYFDLFTTLALYHTGVQGIINNCATLSRPLDSATDLASLNAACNRYCSDGCVPGQMSCVGALPGKGHLGGGIVVEMLCASSGAQCACID